MKRKQRLDDALVESGLCESVEKARAIIMSGRVYTREIRLDKPGTLIYVGDDLTIRPARGDYASRGALKLKRALDEFSICLDDVVAMDIGAAAGGFTDIMLRAGAKKVYAIDVGYGQMDWRLRNDPRVVVMERTNARYITRENFPQAPIFCGMDVSFISILTVLPAVLRVLEPKGSIVSLIKPQFEAAKGDVGAKGVVREPTVHERVLRDIIAGTKKIGLYVKKLTFSPITGPEGNIEFLAYMARTDENIAVDNAFVRDIVLKAHDYLK